MIKRLQGALGACHLRAFLAATAFLLLAALDLTAVSVRIAAYNIEFGFGAPGSSSYESAQAVIARVDPDIIVFVLGNLNLVGDNNVSFSAVP